MQSGLYVALSAQVALDQQMTSIANNVANIGTTGFRADGIQFDSLVSPVASGAVTFVSAGQPYIDRRAGAMTQTGNPLDVAVQGDGFLGFEDEGTTVYSRDGRLQITEAGDVVSITGIAVLDVGGAPIQLDPNAGPPEIAHDGMILQNGRQVGAIGLFALPPDADLVRYGASAVVYDGEAEPILDFTANGIKQGFVEKSNVNPIAEITRLIAVTRAFESVTASINQAETSMKEAIRTLSKS